MKRAQLNFVIDAAALVSFVLLLSTGLLLRYQLPPGSGDLRGMGSGHGEGSRLIVSVWDFTRHQWGEIHYWIAAILIAVLAIHLALHWKWFVSVVRGTHSDASGIRFGLGAASLVALVALAAAPWLAPTSQVTRGNLQERQFELPSHVGTPRDAAALRGSMTVQELSEATGLSAQELRRQLKLNVDPAKDERVGRLLRRHDLTMSDLRLALGIDEHIEKKEAEP